MFDIRAEQNLSVMSERQNGTKILSKLKVRVQRNLSYFTAKILQSPEQQFFA